MTIILMLLFGVFGGIISGLLYGGVPHPSEILLGFIVGLLIDIAYSLKKKVS